MDIKTSVVETAFKKKTPLFNKVEFLAERKIEQRVIDKQQAKTYDRYPEKHPGENLHRLLKGDHSCVTHTLV
jgi:hypothetical protein